MAVGDVVGGGNAKRAVCLMTGAVANTGAPSGAGQTNAVPNYPANQTLANDTGACFTCDSARESTLMIHSTAGTGVMTGTFTLWGYLTAASDWFPIKVNGGTAIGETSSDKIQYQERFLNLGHYDQLFLELESIGGTATAFEAWLVTGKRPF